MAGYNPDQMDASYYIAIVEEHEMAEAFCVGIVEDLVEKVVADNLETCSVCMEEVWRNQDPATLPCGHTFHKTCVGGWLGRVRTDTCPTCRAKVPVKVRQTLRPKPPPKKKPAAKKPRRSA